MKTLGQIAFEELTGHQLAPGQEESWRKGADVWDWHGQGYKDAWESAAQAVRAAVIEECAKICDELAKSNEGWTEQEAETLRKE